MFSYRPASRVGTLVINACETIAERNRRSFGLNLATVALLSLLLLITGCAIGQAQRDVAPDLAPGSELIILLHGYGRGIHALEGLSKHLEESGYKPCRIGYKSLFRSIDEIESEVERQLANCRYTDAAVTHFVGHSLGGLLVRSILGKRKIQNLGKVVLLGTPNHGSPLVDRYLDRWWFSLLGSALSDLRTIGSEFIADLPVPDYPMGVIAGTRSYGSTKNLFVEKNDGMVSVLSVRTEGMSDFIELEEDHTTMRSSRQVAHQIRYFLRHNFFERSPEAHPIGL